MMTGVNPQKHGVFFHKDFSTKNHDYKSWLWHGRAEFGLDPLAILCYWDENKRSQNVEEDAGTFRYNEYVMDEDLEILSTPIYDEDLSYITEEDHEMILVSIDTTDYAGHGFAFSAYEPKYVKAVEKVDA